jgi:hypothetical protein
MTATADIRQDAPRSLAAVDTKTEWDDEMCALVLEEAAEA